MVYKNTPRPYKKENEQYGSKPEQKKNRARRNKVRQQAIKEGRAHVGDGTDVDHKKPISKGGSDKKSNLRVVKRSKNRSFARTSKKKVKSKKGKA